MRSVENLLEKHIISSCEKAFRDGLTSADIYDIILRISTRKYRHEDDTSWIGYIASLTFWRKLFWILASTVATILVFIFLVISSSNSPDLINYWPISKIIHPESRCLLPSHPIIMEMTRPITNCSICTTNNGYPVLELTSFPSRDTFASIAYSSRPIIVRGGVRLGKEAKNFSLLTLKGIFESEPGGLESVMDECQFLPFRSSFQNLAQVLATVSAEGLTELPIQPWYVGWSNCHPVIAEKLRTLIPRPKFLPLNSEASAIDWIFIGSPGYGASMHLDYVRRPSFQAQLAGRKRWTLQPVPECESSCPPKISFTINSGDLLFLDTNSWYHETLIEGNELSISIGSEYD